MQTDNHIKRILQFSPYFQQYSSAVAIGAVAERSRLGFLLVFVFIWTTIVYNPIACWTWNPNGWENKAGGLDFAGGTPVHIASGTAGLAISVYLGKRDGWGPEEPLRKPYNSSHVVLGTAFLWFGWFGFNGGNAFTGTMRAAMACTVTNVSSFYSGIAYLFEGNYLLTRVYSWLPRSVVSPGCSGTGASRENGQSLVSARAQ